MITRDELKERVEAALEPWLTKAKKYWLSDDKTFFLTADKAGQLSLLPRSQIGDRPRIAPVISHDLRENLTPRAWDKLFVKAAIYLSTQGLYDRSDAINEKKQMKIKWDKIDKAKQLVK